VQVIGHQQTKAAMPDELVMIVHHGGKNGVASVRATELIVSLRQTFNGDEESTAFGDPLGNGMRKFFCGRASPLGDGKEHGQQKKVRTNGAHGVTRPTDVGATRVYKTPVS